MPNIDQVHNTLAAIDTAKTKEAIIEHLSNYLLFYGFKTFAISQLANPAQRPLDTRIAIATWPKEYLELRASEPDELHDPIIREAWRCDKPFRWSQAYARAGKKGKAMMDRARDFGLCDGLVFPIRSLDSMPGGVSLAGETQQLSDQDVRLLHLVSIHAYDRLEYLNGPGIKPLQVELSPRELEVVNWLAGGKTHRDIAVILKLSEKTVEKYSAAAREKLEALNSAHAVNNAIRVGLVLP